LSDEITYSPYVRKCSVSLFTTRSSSCGAAVCGH
jgi:hypothetical protein